MGVDELGDRGDIRDATDVARLDEHHCLRIRVLAQRVRNALDGYASGQTGLGIDVGLHPDGHKAGQHEAKEERLVQRTRDNHLVARLADCHGDRHVAVR